MMGEVRTLEVARLGLVEYAAALKLQDAMVAARLRAQIGDTLVLLEHPHVFTLGRGADEGYLISRRPDVPVFRVSRGGQVTYHGPGQLIGYPIIKLEGARRDVMLYLRALEQVMIGALERLAVRARRREGLTGVWVGERKLASIGVGLRRWITLHGFALNLNPDLTYFDAMIPCGINGCRMTSLAELGRELSMPALCTEIEKEFAAVFDYPEVRRADAALLWHLLEPGQFACEADR